MHDDAVAVALQGVTKRFGSVIAVDGIDLVVRTGEFFTFLGPSGSGKTTCLRMIAGFEQPTSGSIVLHGRDVAGSPPYDRDVNTVFQDYALFPHMTVGANVEYGLRVKGVARAERRRRAAEALEMVRLAGFGDRKPAQLSGGQRQRVALARALVNRPALLLLDEPLGALDLKLRQEMQVELKRIQSEVGITFIYVTHDQDEALAMSDRLAVFNHGRIEQVGAPAQVYEHPASVFVAGFVGTSNVVSGAAAHRIRGQRGTFTVRPEKIHVSPRDGAPGRQPVRTSGTVREVLYLGERTRYAIDLDDGGELVAVEQNVQTAEEARAKKGLAVHLSWDPRFEQDLHDEPGPHPPDSHDHDPHGHGTGLAAPGPRAATTTKEST